VALSRFEEAVDWQDKIQSFYQERIATARLHAAGGVNTNLESKCPDTSVEKDMRRRLSVFENATSASDDSTRCSKNEE
jgi:hypothetical protein